MAVEEVLISNIHWIGWLAPPGAMFDTHGVQNHEWTEWWTCEERVND